MKKLLAILLVAVMALGVLPFAASAEETWSYTLVDGVLTITGTGAVGTKDTQEADYPWHDKRAEITEIVVSDGITELGARPFSNCTALTKITFGKDCVTFAQDTMSYCGALEEIVFNGTVESIGQGIVYSSGNFTKVTITGQTKDEFIALTQVKPYNTDFERDTITWTVNGDEPEGPVAIKIFPKFGKWENWINSPNNPKNVPGATDDEKQPGVTQLLVGISDANDAKIDIDAALTWKVTISAGDESKTITMAPATKALDYNLYRFETCLGEGENQFVPVNGTDYTVQITVLGEDGAELYKSEAVSGFTCPMDPVVPETPVDPPVDPPVTGDATVMIAVLAVVALFGAAVVTKKVFVK